MFINELSLQQKFINLLKSNSLSNESILSEFNARFGNVDIVKVIYDRSNLLSHNHAVLLSNYQYAKVLAFLHRNAVRTTNYLKKATDYNDKTLNEILNKLVKTQIINEISPERFVISNSFEFPNLQFISYEAKLHKWKKAILQASINKKFSSYSYVVLPIDLAKKLFEKNISYFHSYNVGLIGVSDYNMEYLFVPKKKVVRPYVNPSLILSIAKYQIETSKFAGSVDI